MKIKITDIEYDLFDEITNPDNDIKAEDLELPTHMIIEQHEIDDMFGESFNIDDDVSELISCRTGFCANNFKHEVIHS